MYPNGKEVALKLVFFGPPGAGKATALHALHRALRVETRGPIVSVTTGSDRTLFFDFFPQPTPRLRGGGLRVQIFAVTGPIDGESTCRALVEEARGVIFVADSQPERADDNLRALELLRESLGAHGQRLATLPHVFAWNKRDLPGVLSLPELTARLNRDRAPAFETTATTGRGLFDALKAITSQMLGELPGRRTPNGEDLGRLSRGETPKNGARARVTPRRDDPAPRPTPSPPTRQDPTPHPMLSPLSHLAATPRPDPTPRPMLTPLSTPRPDPTPRPSPSPLNLMPTAILPARDLPRSEDSPDTVISITVDPSQITATESRLTPDEPPRRPTFLQPLAPERFDQTAAGSLPRPIQLSQVVPVGPLRDQVQAVEQDLQSGQSAQAVRRARSIFVTLTAADAAREPEEGQAWRALSLGLPVDRYLRFREAARNADAGIASHEDALFALFFLIDAILR